MVLPGDLTRAVNGVLDQSLLAPVGDRGLLHHTAARAWRPLVALAARAGFGLTYTYGGTYRTYGEQVALFRQRYTTTIRPMAPSKVWAGVRYWQLPNTAMAAVPGTSNHGLGLAVDTAIGSGPGNVTGIGPRLDWMLATAPQFGWSWETQSEGWHIRYIGGDTPPPAVLLYEASLGIQPTVPSSSPATTPETTTPAPTEDDMTIQILRSMSDPPEFYAEFVAMCDSAGHSIEVQWSGDGDDPAVKLRMQRLRDVGIAEANITLAGLQSNRLHPKHRPGDIRDNRHTWSDADFAP